jgi:hypothetical protein
VTVAPFPCDAGDNERARARLSAGSGPLLPGVTPDATQSLVAVTHLGAVLDTLACTTIPSDVTTDNVASTNATRLVMRSIPSSL